MAERFIDAKAVKQKAVMVEKLDGNGCPYEFLAVPLITIENFPTIEAKPVVHAHWEKEFFTNYRQRVCSVCFATVRQTLYDDGKPRLFNYCPWCGAQMDEEKIINNE